MRYLAEVGAKIQGNHRHTGMLPCTIDREDQVDQERVAYPSSCQRPSASRQATPSTRPLRTPVVRTSTICRHTRPAVILERGGWLDHAAQAAVLAVPHVGRAVADFAQRDADRIQRRNLVIVIEALRVIGKLRAGRRSWGLLRQRAAAGRLSWPYFLGGRLANWHKGEGSDERRCGYGSHQRETT